MTMKVRCTYNFLIIEVVCSSNILLLLLSDVPTSVEDKGAEEHTSDEENGDKSECEGGIINCQGLLYLQISDGSCLTLCNSNVRFCCSQLQWRTKAPRNTPVMRKMETSLSVKAAKSTVKVCCTYKFLM